MVGTQAETVVLSIGLIHYNFICAFAFWKFRFVLPFFKHHKYFQINTEMQTLYMKLTGWPHFHSLRFFLRNRQEHRVIKQTVGTLNHRNISFVQCVEVMTCGLELRYNHKKMLRIIKGKISISNIFSTDTLACVLGQAYAALNNSSLYNSW